MPDTHRARSSSPAKKTGKTTARKKGKKSARKKKSGDPFNPESLPGTKVALSLPKESMEIVFGVAMNSNPTSGVVVTGLTPGGLCERSGICVGDVVLSVNGKKVLYAIETTELLKSAAVGTIMLELLRQTEADEDAPAEEEAPEGAPAPSDEAPAATTQPASAREPASPPAPASPTAPARPGRSTPP